MSPNEAKPLSTEADDDFLSIVTLNFQKGDLLIKQGDYGISIYKIVSGKVLVFTESEGTEVPVTTLGSGSVIGEMIFLSGGSLRRSASVRAMADTQLEVWHPELLQNEYQAMPPILRLIIGQSLGRLIRMNRLMTKLTKEKGRKGDRQAKMDPRSNRRQFYRKEVNVQARFRPLSRRGLMPFTGEIKDISMGGVGIQMRTRSVADFPHKLDDELAVDAVLPNGRELSFRARIVRINKTIGPGLVFLGLAFTELRQGDQKELGFFMMPA